MPTFERLDYGSPDGSQWGGTSSDALGLYGSTPVSQYTAVGAASTYGMGSCNGGTSGMIFGFSTHAMASSMVLQVSTITVALRRLGIVL